MLPTRCTHKYKVPEAVCHTHNSVAVASCQHVSHPLGAIAKTKSAASAGHMGPGPHAQASQGDSRHMSAGAKEQSRQAHHGKPQNRGTQPTVSTLMGSRKSHALAPHQMYAPNLITSQVDTNRPQQQRALFFFFFLGIPSWPQ